MAKHGDADAAEAAYASVMDDFCRARAIDDMRTDVILSLYTLGTSERDLGHAKQMEASYRKLITTLCQGRRLADVAKANPAVITGEKLMALQGATITLAITFYQQGQELCKRSELSQARLKLKEAFDMAQAGIVLVEKTQRVRITPVGIQVAGCMALILAELGACGGTAGRARSPKECIDMGEKLAREVLALAQKLGGEGHPLAAGAANYLAVLLERRREYVDAADAYAAVMHATEKRLGADHENVVKGNSKLQGLRNRISGSWGLNPFPPIVSHV
jgi:hypothetical protein